MILDDLGLFLQTNGFGTLGQTIFLGTQPQDAPGSGVPDAILSLFEIPGLPASKTHDVTGPAVEQPHVQLRFRGTPFGYAAARTKAQQAFVLFDGVVNQTINGVFYQQIVCLNSPFGLPADEWNRPFILLPLWCKKAP